MAGKPFEIREDSAEDGVVRLSASGALDADSAMTLADRLSQLRVTGSPVQLDLSELESIDTAGVEVLVEAHAESLLKSWRFNVEPKMAPGVEGMLRLAHLDGLLDAGSAPGRSSPEL
jgi:ABC-type transporter Mla MlaB component